MRETRKAVAVLHLSNLTGTHHMECYWCSARDPSSITRTLTVGHLNTCIRMPSYQYRISSMGIPIVKIRQTSDCVIFIMGISILGAVFILNSTQVSDLPIPPNHFYFRADSRFVPSQWETALLCKMLVFCEEVFQLTADRKCIGWVQA